MIGDISVKTNLYLVSGYTDMRRSIDGLCATIQNIFGSFSDSTHNGHLLYTESFASMQVVCMVKIIFSLSDQLINIYTNLINFISQYALGSYAARHNSLRDNTMITKNPKTSDTGCISKKKPPKKP